MARRDGHNVEVTRPQLHRPNVMVVRSIGTRKVVGDGSPFTQNEYIMLQRGYVESTTPRPKIDIESLRTELQKAIEKSPKGGDQL